MEKQKEEKRRFQRIGLHAPLRYQIRGSTHFDNAISDNISLGGIGFINNLFIAPSNLIMLEIEIAAKILRPVGRVVFSSPMPHSNRNRLGIEFIEIDPAEKNYLSEYINLKLGKI
ncbi:MAG: PilZ domain-containing protein [Candidatus Omnitrophica bacterium]|nr:PilZ domain-containing protein [Candidatus Omnitrophota bacterium]